MVLLIREEEVRALLNLRGVFQTVLETYRILGSGGKTASSRLQVEIPGGWLRVQAGLILDQGVVGFKSYIRTKCEEGNCFRYVVVLYDVRSGEALSIMDGNYLTVARTAAIAGVATQYMACEDWDTLGVIGSGNIAKTTTELLASLREFKAVKVYSRSEARRREFKEQISRRTGVSVTPSESPKEVVEGNRILVTATSNDSMNPIVLGDWIPRGTMINALGAAGRGVELDQVTYRRASRVVVDSPEAFGVSPELRAVLDAGILRREEVWELSQVVQRGPTCDQQGIHILRSVGFGLLDVASALWVYREAARTGKGIQVEGFPSVKEER